jgi:hypothetical protein
MLEEQLERLVAAAPRLQERLLKTASFTAEARSLLLDPNDNTAAGLYLAARRLYGIELLNWEPETIWLTMKADGIDLPEGERNKLQAAITLQVNPSFYWDNIVFQQTVQALSDEPYDPEALQEVHPAHMDWAVYEAGVIRGLDPDAQEIPEFDEDVQMYVAVCLKRAGYVVTPKSLNFAQDDLDLLLPKEVSRFQKEVRDAWKQLDKTRLADTEFYENRLGVQLSKLASSYLFTKERAEKLGEEVASLQMTTVI